MTGPQSYAQAPQLQLASDPQGPSRLLLRHSSARLWWIGQFVVAAVLLVLTVAIELVSTTSEAPEAMGVSGQVLVQFVFRGLILSLAINGLLLALRKPNVVRPVDKIVLLIEASVLALANLVAIIGATLENDDQFGVFLLGSVPIWGLLSAAALVVLIVTIVGNATAAAIGRLRRIA